MHLKKLKVENFKALEKIDVDFDSLVTVIIGPNAIGKTTVLEAIRLAKALLAPRTQNETNQTLHSMGAISPHAPQSLFPSAFTNNSGIPLSIKCTYGLSDSEITKIEELQPQIASAVAQQNAGLFLNTPAQIVAFLSSPPGQLHLSRANQELSSEISALKQRRTIALNLNIDFRTGQITGEYPIQQLLFGALEKSLNPRKSLFSYFPADRAMPIGEQPVQLGLADISNQLESYNSQPQLKYNRLKHIIFSSIIEGDYGRNEIKEYFRSIFDNVLKGRELGELGINQLGMLSIPIIDKQSGKTFEIDNLSSGEKGLLLTFLLIATSINQDGIILLDEPELHLNPAVCRELLQFFVDEYAKKFNIQGIICSHSAELLAGAFERPECSLFHLKGPLALAKVRHSDKGEIRDALRLLGSSESEALLFKGTISVEGIHDYEILRAGFDDLLRRYKIIQLNGRPNIEINIIELQKAELRGEEIGNHYFIFDFDGKPTELKNSKHVKLLQLSRYCLENYLLDIDILTDHSRNTDFSKNPKSTTTEMRDILRDTALSQLNEFVSRIVFREMGLERVGFDMTVIRQETKSLVADGLWRTIADIKSRFENLNQTTFQEQFITLFDDNMKALKPVWEEKWRELCNGKKLFHDLRRNRHFECDLLKLKKSIIVQMRSQRTEAYASLENLLRNLIDG